MNELKNAEDIVRIKTPAIRAIDTVNTFSIGWAIASISFILFTGIWVDFILQTLIFSVGYLLVYFFLNHVCEEHTTKSQERKYLEEARTIALRLWIGFVVLSIFDVLLGSAICGSTTNFILYNVPVEREWYYTYLKWDGVIRSLIILFPLYFYNRLAYNCAENKPIDERMPVRAIDAYKKIYYHGRTPLQVFIFVIVGLGLSLFSYGLNVVLENKEPSQKENPNESIRIHSNISQNNAHFVIKYRLLYATTNPACSTHTPPGGGYNPTVSFPLTVETPVLATVEDVVDGKMVSTVYKDYYNPGFCQWKLDGIKFETINDVGQKTAKGKYSFSGTEPCLEGTSNSTAFTGATCKLFEQSEYSMNNYPSTTLPDPVFGFNLYTEPEKPKDVPLDENGNPVDTNKPDTRFDDNLKNQPTEEKNLEQNSDSRFSSAEDTK